MLGKVKKTATAEERRAAVWGRLGQETAYGVVGKVR
jgi:hypothetical protein